MTPVSNDCTMSEGVLAHWIEVIQLANSDCMYSYQQNSLELETFFQVSASLLEWQLIQENDIYYYNHKE